MEYQNGRDYVTDVDIENEYSPPPSIVRRNPVLEGQLNVWHELRRYDQHNTGLITATDFRQALENLGIKFGSRPADKILVLMKFTPEGMVDYLKLGEEVEAFMRTHGSPKPVRRDTGSMFTVTPRLTTDPEPLPDEREKAINLRTKERVFQVQDKIYEAFCAYEREEITSERFLDIIQDLGIQPTHATVRVLRRRDEVGSCSYANLIQALCLLEEKPQHDLRASPVRSPWQSPGRSPVKDNGQPPPYKTRLMTLPPSLRDSNVITWSDDPKREKSSAKATTTRRVVCEEVITMPSRYVQENYDPEVTPTEVATAKREKIYAMVRDFIEGTKSAVEFRLALREMGIEANRELERLISSHERDGQLKFQDFLKVLNIYHEGDVRYSYTEEQIQPRATANIFSPEYFDAPPPASPSSSEKKPQYIRGSGDFMSWEKDLQESEFDDQPVQRPRSPTRRFENSKDFAVWETDAPSTQHLPTTDPLGRPNTPKRHYSHANSSRVSELMNWSNDNSTTNNNSSSAHHQGLFSVTSTGTLTQIAPTNTHTSSTASTTTATTTGEPQGRRLLRSTGNVRNSTSDVNILTWDNAATPAHKIKSPDNTHAVLPNGTIHPKAPFGTERDQFYNINPHRPYQDAERKR